MAEAERTRGSLVLDETRGVCGSQTPTIWTWETMTLLWVWLKAMVLNRGADNPSRGHLTMSANMFACPNLAGAGGVLLGLVDRGQLAKHPMVHRMPPQQRISWPKTSIVLRLKKPA